jgi:3-mercaptopyruvate sulfurtransferase SseA
MSPRSADAAHHAFTADDVDANRRFFEAKLRAERQLNDVVGKVKGKLDADFLLLDTRDREAYARGHIPGALCVPLAELDRLAERLPRDKELVTYCWKDT